MPVKKEKKVLFPYICNGITEAEWKYRSADPRSSKYFT